MTDTKPSKTERQSKEQLKGNLGQKEAQIEKEKHSDLSHMGPSVSCFEYDPSGVTWTAFFKTPAGGFGNVWRFPNESTSQNYIGALKSRFRKS